MKLNTKIIMDDINKILLYILYFIGILINSLTIYSLGINMTTERLNPCQSYLILTFNLSMIIFSIVQIIYYYIIYYIIKDLKYFIKDKYYIK